MRNTERPTDVTRTQVEVDRSEKRQERSPERSPEYLKGYRDGVRDRQVAARPNNAGDGILGALLAIALLAGIGYFGYNYATTGRLLPADVDLNIEPGTLFTPFSEPQPSAPQ